jgi:hypothetical protein
MSAHHDLMRSRSISRSLIQIVVVAFAALFYLALVPIAVVFSGPIYHAIRCTFSECRQPGVAADFYLQSSGSLRLGSRVRLPNGQAIGEITGFHWATDERYIVAAVRIDDASASVLEQPLRCQVMANFTLEMDADLVVSSCPGLGLPPTGDPPFVCGSVDHFERIGQEVRRFVLEHLRPGDAPAEVRLTGPCGADNEATTAELRSVLASTRGTE